ncbi:MAG: hypothetical protein O2877_00470, partial [bacterium]|nr:hypothetical protein [bacterium]
MDKRHKKKTRFFLGSWMIAVLLIGPVSVGFILARPTPVQASSHFKLEGNFSLREIFNTTEAAIAPIVAVDQAVAGGKSAEAGTKTVRKAGDIALDTLGLVGRSVLLNLLSFIVNRLSYDAAVALVSAATGQTALIEFRTPEEYFKDVGLDIAGEAIESLTDVLNDGLNLEFDLCAPEDPMKRLGLQIGLQSMYTKNLFEPRCEFQNFLSNWEAVVGSFTGEVGGTQSILRRFASAYSPGQTELSASIDLTVNIRGEVLEKKALLSQANIENKGFKDVLGVISGQRET